MQQLFERGADYFEVATGGPPAEDEAPRAWVAGPPSRSVADKRVVGVFERGRLIGVLDALTDWPEEGTWTVGMVLLDPAFRGLGLGRTLLDRFMHWAAEAGAHTIQTAVVIDHEDGIGFLEHVGFERHRVVEGYQAGSRSTSIVFFRKSISSGSAHVSAEP